MDPLIIIFDSFVVRSDSLRLPHTLACAAKRVYSTRTLRGHLSFHSQVQVYRAIWRFDDMTFTVQAVILELCACNWDKCVCVLQVNGTVVVPPVTSVSGVKIYLSGKFVVLETSFGLRVRFDGNHHADVTVPTSYNGLLCGLCGKEDVWVK